MFLHISCLVDSIWFTTCLLCQLTASWPRGHSRENQKRGWQEQLQVVFCDSPFNSGKADASGDWWGGPCARHHYRLVTEEGTLMCWSWPHCGCLLLTQKDHQYQHSSCAWRTSFSVVRPSLGSIGPLGARPSRPCRSPCFYARSSVAASCNEVATSGKSCVRTLGQGRDLIQHNHMGNSYKSSLHLMRLYLVKWRRQFRCGTPMSRDEAEVSVVVAAAHFMLPADTEIMWPMDTPSLGVTDGHTQSGLKIPVASQERDTAIWLQQHLKSGCTLCGPIQISPSPVGRNLSWKFKTCQLNVLWVWAVALCYSIQWISVDSLLTHLLVVYPLALSCWLRFSRHGNNRKAKAFGTTCLPSTCL